jgi:hypothetical protein
MHCHPLSVSVAVVLTLVFTMGLAETTPANWTHCESFFSSLLPLQDRMCNYHLLLLIWFPFMAPEPSSCDLCMHTTWTGNVVTRTLLFHTYYSCAGSVIRSCTHNHTTCLVCSHGNQHICFNSTFCPQEQWLDIGASATMGTSSAACWCLTLIIQCLYSLMHVQP